jgi:hypothetical protein
MKKLFFTLTFLLCLTMTFNAQSQIKWWQFDTPEWIAKKMFYAPDYVDSLGVLAGPETPVFIEGTNKMFVHPNGNYLFKNALRLPGPGLTDPQMPFLPTTRAVAFEMGGPGNIEIISLSTTPNTGQLLITNGARLLHTIQIKPNTFTAPDGGQLPLDSYHYEGGPSPIFIYSADIPVDLYYIQIPLADTIHREPVTFNVQVPADTKECWIAGSFNGWNTASHQMQKVDDFNYTLTVEDVDMSFLEYKYMSGPGWAYVEKDAVGDEVPNRAYQPNDTVDSWLSIYDPATAVDKPITFEVTVPNHVQSVYLAGDFNNWNMPDPNTMMSFMQMTPNGKLFSKTIMINNLTEQTRYKFTAGPDWQFVQTQENEFNIQNTEADTIRHTVFGFYGYANSPMQPKDWNFSHLFAGEDSFEFNSTYPDDGLLFFANNEFKMNIDKKQKFNDQRYFLHRLKTNGPVVSNPEKPNQPDARALAFNVGGDCQIAVAALASDSTGSSELKISNGESIIGSIPLMGSTAAPEGEVPMFIYNYQGPAGPVFIYDVNSGADIYYLGVSAYAGIPQPQQDDSVTYTVKVPEGTQQVCIAGQFNYWTPGMHWMNRLDSVTYTLTVYGANADMEYKYLNGHDWSFEEVDASGKPIQNRKWSQLDIVEGWAKTFIPDDTHISYDDIHTTTGADISVDIKMSSNQIQEAIAYQFELQFDTTTLAYTGYTMQGTVAETGTVEVNSTKDPGILYVSFMTAEPFAVNSTLIKLNFKVVNKYNNNQTTAWFNQCFIDNHEVYNYNPGTIYIDYIMKGDVDGNFRIQAYDAALTLQHSVGKDPLPQLDPLPWEPWRMQAADVDGVPGITANDAAMILQYSAYIINSFAGDNPVVTGAMKAPDATITNVEVIRDQQNLIFKSYGNLVGFNLYIEKEMDAFGTPVISNDISMSAINIGDKVYAIGLAALEPMAQGVTFMTIPMLRDLPEDFTFRMFINSNEISKVAEAQTGIKSLADVGISLYPNPVRDMIRLNNLTEGAIIRISDISGRTVIQKEVNTDSDRIDVSLLSSGIYSIAIIQNKATAVSKFIKQ